MTQKKLAFKGDFDIMKFFIIEYVLSKPFVRTFVAYIIFGTLVVCTLNILTVEATRKLTSQITEKNPIGESLVYFAILTVFSVTLHEVNNFIFATPVQHISRLTGKNSFRNFINMELTKYNKIGCGEIQTIIDRESKAISELIEVIFINVCNIIFTVCLAASSIYTNLGVGLMIVILLTLVLYIVSTIYIVHWRTNIRHDYNTSQQLCSNHLHDALINHETIVAYKMEEEEALKYEGYVSGVEYECNRLWRSLSVLFLVNKSVFALQCFLVLTCGNIPLFSRKLNSKDFVYYIGINKTLCSSFGNLGFFYSRYTQALLNVRTSFKPEYIEEKTDKREIEGFYNQIEIKDGRFSYETKEVLKNINLTIKKGEKVAIIGKNGSGKTSLIKMILRFEEYSGIISLDGLDIQDIANNSYRNLISYSPQNSFLFNETVIYNLIYGTTIVDREEVYAMSKKLKVHESIKNLENQYETEVGDKGHKLSGGERQKVILLRSALKNSQVLILDEPTSALDKKAELEILSSLISENAEKTMIIILHNLELLYLFDKVLNIHDNTVTSHIKRNGEFEALKFLQKELLS